MAEPYGLGIELSRKNFGFGSVCVRDWSGILWERSLRSEQRYSGKPDGVAGTHKSINN
ncbi:MAG: hypothetical protein IJ961_03340 [Bacteroidales bacterium]|nr:hypothetical protein [Bacteroidales bacterium]